MKISQFSHSLSGEGTLQQLLRAPSSEIFSFHPLFPELPFEEDILYICHADEIITKPSQLTLNFLIVSKNKNDTISEELASGFPNSNLLLLYTENHEKFVYDQVGRFFMREMRYAHHMAQLLEVSTMNKGLQALVDEVYRIIHCPIVIIDTSYRILAISMDGNSLPGNVFEQQRSQGYLNEHTLNRLKRDAVYDRIRENKTGFLYNKADDEDCYWYNTLINVYGVEVAELGIMERGRKFSELDFQLFNYLRQLIGWEMEKVNFFAPSKGLMHSIFISELLEQKFATSEEIDNRCRMLGWDDAPGYYVLTVFSTDQNYQRNKADIFALNVQSLLPNTRWLVTRSYTLFLISSEKSISVFSPESVLSDLFRYNHMYGILSNHFKKLKYLKKYFDQTMAVREFVDFTRSESPIFYYAEFTFSHIAKILNESYDIRDFYHPLISLIYEYDQANNTEYLKTLHEYLLHTDNPTLCSNRLCIHKNTFFYRMNRIRELFSLNLTSGIELAHLLMTLEFMNLKNEENGN